MSAPFYQPPAPSIETSGNGLPQWAKTYRTILMCFHTIGLLFIAIVIIAYTIHFEPGAGGKSQMAWTLLLLWISFIFTSIPYAIANIVYGVLWITSLRGNRYRVNRASSLYLALPPLLIAALVIGWLVIAYKP